MKNNITNPLADRMRPETIDEFVGQEYLIGKERILRKIIESDAVPSMIFWGPPGSGKTTLASIIATSTGAEFVKISAVSSGVKELREIIKKARFLKSEKEKKTILFIDEIHRFNKSQQDALLPYVEDGTLTLIGATTENPSFEVNSALLSRSRVFVLKMLEPEDIEVIIKNALSDAERGLGKKRIDISEKDIKFIAAASGGDARAALNVLELSVNLTTSENKSNQIKVDRKIIEEAFQKSASLYDKGGEEHYNIISALHKSMRGGDANAALYWLGRMLEGGEDPLYVARRLIRFASEDIGLANSFALPQATAAYDACHYIGMPECGVNLAQAAVYMAKSKKSNKLYEAYLEVQKDIKNFPNFPVPLHLRNAPTDLMKNLGYGKGYKYTPKYENSEEAKQDYLPEKLKNRKYLKD